jgi:hypothetical protein
MRFTGLAPLAYIVLCFSCGALAVAEDGRTLRSIFSRNAPRPENAAAGLEASLRKNLREEEAALKGSNPKLSAVVALERLVARLNRLPADSTPLDPTQQAISAIYRADPPRQRLVTLSCDLLSRRLESWDRTNFIGGNRDDQFLAAVQIFQAIGLPKDVNYWHSNVREAIALVADEGAGKQIEIAEGAAGAIWRVAGRAGDQWPNMTKEIDPFTFVWAFHHDETFRPENWPVRLRWAGDVGQPDYLRIYGFDHTPLPLNLTRPLDDTNIENLAFLILFAMRHDQNSSGKLTPVQIAAVNLAGRSRSLYFAPSIRDVLEQTESPELRRAAEAALRACTRPSAVVTPEPDTEAQLALDTQRIDEIFASWKPAAAGTPHVEELRTLIGLDYGDDRAAWLLWWERDQQSRKMCSNGDRKFLYRGSVRDERGRPLSQATVSVSVAGEFTYHRYGGPIVDWVDTDRDGRFLLRCGFSTPDRDHRGIKSAVFNVNKPGYHFLAATGALKRYFTEFDLTEEPLIEISPDEIVHPRSAVDLEIILLPAAQVEVSVVNAGGEPVKPLNIEARWTELHPEESSPVAYCGCCGESWASPVFTPGTAERHQPRRVYLAAESSGLPPAQVAATVAPYAKLGTDPAVSFYFSQFRPGISRRFALFNKPKANEPDAVSNAITLPTAGRYRVQLTWDPAAAPEQRLRAGVTRLREAGGPAK